jgi:hypothetical protein
MIRRFVSKKAPATLATARRSFYYDGAGESGIIKVSLVHSVYLIRCTCVLTVYWIYKFVFGRYSNRNVFIDDSTDLWEDDGTKMEGPEAVANLRIQKERLQPFLDDIQAQLDSNTGV